MSHLHSDYVNPISIQPSEFAAIHNLSNQRKLNMKSTRACKIVTHTSSVAHWKPATTVSLTSCRYWQDLVTSINILGPEVDGPKHQIFLVWCESIPNSSDRNLPRSLTSFIPVTFPLKKKSIFIFLIEVLKWQSLKNYHPCWFSPIISLLLNYACNYRSERRY